MDKKRDLAIAYDVKKRNQKKKYADGGIIESVKQGVSDFVERQKQDLDKYEQVQKGTYVDPTARSAKPYAQGGMIKPKSLAEAIMERRAMKDGGMVDIDDNNKEEPNEFYHLNEHEVLEENMNEELIGVKQPLESNQHSKQLDSDKHDMIDQIRSKINMKRQFKDK